MAKLGFHVTIFPIFAHRFDVAAIYADIPDTIEVLYDETLENLPEFLDCRDEYFDTIWVARTHNLDRVRQMLERYALGKGNPPRVVLDTEAIASVRDQTRATLTSQAYDRKAALAAEFHGASCCQNIVAVTEAEADLIRSIGYADVSVIGFTRELSLGARDFDARQGLLFIGAIHEMDSPNYDSLCWFTDTVLPLVEQQLGYETQLTVAGYTAPHVTLERFENHPRIRLSGQVAETETLYNAHRVFIAPTRFAAGAPYKLYEAASHGVPIAATELLRGQLGWQHGLEILSADISDPAKFADNIVALYRDRELWHRLRDNAADRLRRENSPEHYVNALSRILLLTPPASRLRHWCAQRRLGKEGPRGKTPGLPHFAQIVDPGAAGSYLNPACLGLPGLIALGRSACSPLSPAPFSALPTTAPSKGISGEFRRSTLWKMA